MLAEHHDTAIVRVLTARVLYFTTNVKRCPCESMRSTSAPRDFYAHDVLTREIASRSDAQTKPVRSGPLSTVTIRGRMDHACAVEA